MPPVTTTIPDANRFRRLVPTRQQRRDALGFKLCLVCHGKLPKRRHSYCSDECWTRNTPSHMRRLVERRDNGICAGCHRQCKIGALRWGKQLTKEEWRALPNWQADHIIPVIEGGGLCGLDGYRTLCSECHNGESAALAARLALSRRLAAEAQRASLFTGEVA